MALTRDYKQTIRERAGRDPNFAASLMNEAISSFGGQAQGILIVSDRNIAASHYFFCFYHSILQLGSLLTRVTRLCCWTTGPNLRQKTPTKA